MKLLHLSNSSVQQKQASEVAKCCCQRGLLGSLVLQGMAYRVVLGVCSASKAIVYHRWKELELQLADAASESMETVKYLTTLESSLECLYTSEPWFALPHPKDPLLLRVHHMQLLHIYPTRVSSSAEPDG
jgi:hypothetical protein